MNTKKTKRISKLLVLLSFSLAVTTTSVASRMLPRANTVMPTDFQTNIWQ